MNQVLRCDWLSERASRVYLSRADYLLYGTENRSLTKFVPSTEQLINNL